MPTDERNSVIMRDRRTILAALNMVYPGALDGEELFAIVLAINPEYTRTFACRDYAYLAEKGYVEHLGRHGLDAPRYKTVHDSAYRLTAQGTDVANRIVSDPALNV